MASKRCSLCKEEKNTDHYHKDGSRYDGVYPYCKPCRKEFTKRSYYDNPKRQRERAIKYCYGITWEELKEMAVEQAYACKICNVDFKENFINYNHRHIHVDHCHNTGEVRGILCQPCNHLLGKACDKIHILENAIMYLKASKELSYRK